MPVLYTLCLPLSGALDRASECPVTGLPLQAVNYVLAVRRAI